MRATHEKIARACAGTSVVIAALAGSLPASARPTFSVHAGSLAFFADTLGIVARTAPAFTFANGLRLRGESAYIDLVHNRVVVAGHAHLERGTRAIDGDAIAVDLDGKVVDVLDAQSGARETKLDLAQFTTVPIDADRFAFPDLDDRRAYIQARGASITAHANARFIHAKFPNSPGAFPVPSYLYTYSSRAGFGASSLGGANFDQPFGILGGDSSLLAGHIRYETGIGPTFAIDDHLVYGDNAYVVASVDSLQRATRIFDITAYDRMGTHFTQSFTGQVGDGTSFGSYNLTGAFGHTTSELTLTSGGGLNTGDLSLRSPDATIKHLLTVHLRTDLGFSSDSASILPELPDAAHYRFLWDHDIDIFASTPIFKLPFGTSLGATVEGNRTWFAFPHRIDTLNSSATLSRSFGRKFTAVAAYSSSYTYDIFYQLQGLFFPTPLTPIIAPDGTPFPGFNAFSGATTLRSYTIDSNFKPDANTSIHLVLGRFDDFPQFHGIGSPPYDVSVDARFRPLPNIGLDIGRTYLFDWGGQRYSQWTFSVLP
jgi:hypothetical protein